MEITQSWLVTISRYHFGIYEQRILVSIVDGCQEYFRKRYLAGMMQYAPPMPKNDKRIDIKIAQILDDGDTHYTRVKEAVRQLQHKNIEIYHPDTKTWQSCPLIGMVTHRARSGVLEVIVPAMFLRALYDLRMGYSQFELSTALSLQSPYAVRMYAMIAHQSKPLTVPIAALKQIFGVVDKYSQTRDFLKRVIDPARDILSEAHLASFTYTKVTKGTKVTALTIRRVEPEKAVAQHLDPDSTDLQQAMGEEITNLLLYQVGFTWKELRVHERLIRQSLKLPLAVQIYRDIVHRWYKYNKTKGYIIAAIKSEVGAATK